MIFKDSHLSYLHAASILLLFSCCLDKFCCPKLLFQLTRSNCLCPEALGQLELLCFLQGIASLTVCLSVCLSVFSVLAPILEAVPPYRTVCIPGVGVGVGAGTGGWWGCVQNYPGQGLCFRSSLDRQNSYSFRLLEQGVKRAGVLHGNSEAGRRGQWRGISPLLWLHFCFLSASPWGPGWGASIFSLPPRFIFPHPILSLPCFLPPGPLGNLFIFPLAVSSIRISFSFLSYYSLSKTTLQGPVQMLPLQEAFQLPPRAAWTLLSGLGGAVSHPLFLLWVQGYLFIWVSHRMWHHTVHMVLCLWVCLVWLFSGFDGDFPKDMVHSNVWTHEYYLSW